jgi:hypothetical protein
MIDLDSLVEVKLLDDQNFLKIKETLTRIGVSAGKENKLFQSCHILHKQGRYYIVHFKELFALDGKTSDFSNEDLKRRNAIASLLEDWGLVDIINPEIVSEKANISQIKIISFSDKKNWVLEAKYQIGRKKV